MLEGHLHEQKQQDSNKALFELQQLGQEAEQVSASASQLSLDDGEEQEESQINQ